MKDATISQDWTLQSFVSRLASFNEAPALITVHGQVIQWVSYAVLSEKALSLAAGLAAFGIKSGMHIAIVAPNGSEWVIARLALGAIGAVVCALDDLSTEAELSTALAHSDCRYVMATPRHAATILAIDPKMSVIVIGDGDGSAPAGGCVWQDLFSANSASSVTISSDRPALLAYTSGTTGPPKGFHLTHAHIWANLQPLVAARLIGSGDRVLLPLPLHHVYPFLLGLLTPLSSGAAVVFPEAISGPELVRAIRVADVSVIVGVPRLYAALVSSLEARVAARGSVVNAIFRTLLAASIGIRRRFHVAAGRWLFRRLRGLIGPQLRLLVSGGAHLDPETLWKLAGLGFEVRSGYGLAETASIFTGNLPGVERLGSEGKPFQGGALRIATPDEGGIGEIELTGPNVFRGYCDNPTADAEAFSADGWFRTGDLGRIDEDGFLYVTGRRKETIVLGGGKKVDPEALERIYGSSPFIREIAVLEHQGTLVALVLPDFLAIRAGPSARVDETIRITLVGKSQNLPPYERLAGFALVREPLPRTRLGKYRRFLLPDLYRRSLSDEGPPALRAPTPDDEALLAQPRARRLYDVLLARYPNRSISLEASPQLDLGIDSLEWISLSLALEQGGLSLSEKAFADAITVRDLLHAANRDAAATEDHAASKEQEIIERHWLAPTGGGLRTLGFVVYLVNWFLMRLLFRLRVEGSENLPTKGPYVLVANHGSDLDAPVIIAALSYRRARRLYWAGDAARLFRRRWLNPLWRALHVLPADDRLPSRTLAFGEAVIERGDDLAWFPEGWRTPDGRLQHFLPGIGQILVRTRVPAIPIYVSGTFEALPRNRVIPHLLPVRVVIGRPLAGYALRPSGPEEKAGHQHIADELHQAIAALESQARPGNG